MKRAALLAMGLPVVVAAVLVARMPGQPRHAATPVSAPVTTSQRPSAALGSLAPALPTPTPAQARRKASRPSPASRSRAYTAEALPAILVRIRGCESGNGPTSPGDYSNVNGSSGASGAFQFLDSTWHYVTNLPGKARDYSKATQDWAAIKLLNSEGTTPWNSSRRCWNG